MSKEFTEDEIKTATREVLIKLEINALGKGYVYISEMIWLKYTHGEDIKLMYLYELCGKLHNANYPRVERVIRNSISHIDLKNPYYKSILGETSNFANGNILNLIYYYVIDELKGNTDINNSKLVARVNKLEEDIRLLKRIIANERSTK